MEIISLNKAMAQKITRLQKLMNLRNTKVNKLTFFRVE